MNESFEKKQHLLDELPEEKVGCCNDRCCRCMTRKQWILCNLVCSAITVVIGGCFWLIMSPILLNVGTKVNFVTSPDSFMYESWEVTWLEDGALPSVPYYETFFFFNLTNVDEILQGGKPVVNEVGPWYYRTNITKLDVAFFNDDEDVYYVFWKRYYFEPTMGVSSVDIPITLLNIGYLGAVLEAGSESIVVQLMIGPALDKMVRDIEQYYITPLIASESYDYWLQRCQAIDAACNSTRDMAIVQWGHFSNLRTEDESFGLNNTMVSSLGLTEIFPVMAEYSAYGVTENWGTRADVSIGIKAFNQLIYGPYGLLTDPANFEGFVLSIIDDAGMERKWGLTGQQTFFLLYALALSDASSYNRLFFNGLIAQGSGLFATHTVDEWLWNCVDPLLTYLFPSSPYINLFNNFTTEDIARQRENSYVVQTGKGNYLAVTNVTQFNNNTVAREFFSQPVGVTGNAGTGIFAPTRVKGNGQLPDILAPIQVWSPDHGYPIDFIDYGVKETLEGIPTHRFELSNSTYDVNPAHDIYDPLFAGFVNGTKINEAPVFLCQPHFLLVNPYWASVVAGVKEPDYERDFTAFSVEPISGLGLSGILQLQINFYVTNATGLFDLVYVDVQQGVMYPAVYTQQISMVTPELAQVVDGTLILATKMITGIWIGLICIGGIALLVHSARLFYFRREKPQNQYYTIINTTA